MEEKKSNKSSKLSESEINNKISNLQSDVLNLRSQKRNIRLPKIDLNYQFSNMVGGGRNIYNKKRLSRMKRKKYSNEIGRKKKQIKSYKNKLE